MGKGEKEKIDFAINQSILLGVIISVIISLLNLVFYKPILMISGATKDTKTPMISTAIANVVNIVLNVIFMKMNMGIVGLALATTISRIINVIILLMKLKMNNIEISIKIYDWKEQKETLKSIIKIGTPAGIEKLIIRLGQLVYNSMIISIGVSAYVAHNIAGNIES